MELYNGMLKTQLFWLFSIGCPLFILFNATYEFQSSNIIFIFHQDKHGYQWCSWFIWRAVTRKLIFVNLQTDNWFIYVLVFDIEEEWSAHLARWLLIGIVVLMQYSWRLLFINAPDSKKCHFPTPSFSIFMSVSVVCCLYDYMKCSVINHL